MEDEKLQALVNQRVEITLGGKTYKARRATLKDYATVNRYREERIKNEDTVNLDMDLALYILATLLKPDQDYTIDQLAEVIPLEEITNVTQILETLGFRLPQAKSNENQSTGANSTLT